MDSPSSPSMHPVRGLLLPILAVFLAYVACRGQTLWGEYRALRTEWDSDLQNRAVGYPGVVPVYSHAAGPADWLHDEGDSTLLWAGWDRKAKQHNWFRLKKGDLDAAHLSHPMGRDAIRAIDKPKVESRTGEVWNAMSPRNKVVVGEFQGVALAYPIAVLNKVLVVNDEIHKRPLLVLYKPFVDDAEAVETFSPVVDGTKRRTMGNAGYLCDGKPLLYDRETQSLWVAQDAGLTAIAGPAKGRVMGRIARLELVEWGDWNSTHPDGRLVAGAIRPEPSNLKKP